MFVNHCDTMHSDGGTLELSDSLSKEEVVATLCLMLCRSCGAGWPIVTT